MLALHVLASGSSGNAAVIENTATGAGVLIDCGICKRDDGHPFAGEVADLLEDLHDEPF